MNFWKWLTLFQRHFPLQRKLIEIIIFTKPTSFGFEANLSWNIMISPHIHFSLGCPEYRLIQFLILCHILLTVSLKFVSACIYVIYVLPTLSEYVSPHRFSKICINLHLCDVLPTPGLLAVGFCLRVASGCEQAGIMPARKPRMGHFNCLNPEQDVPTI